MHVVIRLFARLALCAAALAPGLANAQELGIGKEGDAVRLTLSGQDGQEYSVEAVEELLNRGAVWKPVATVATGSSPVLVYDPTCSTRPQNFYRLRLLQGTIPVEVPNFRLIDQTGTARELFYQSDARAVVLVFAGRELTSLNHVAATMDGLADRWSAAGVRFWVVGVGTAADRARWSAQAKTLGLDLPVLEDEGGAVTRQMSQGTAPEALVINPAAWSIVYRGRIVDAVTTAGVTQNHTLLGDALAQHLAGERVSVRYAASVGEAMNLASYSDRTYTDHIAPLFQQHCVRCHSPGNIGPWAMTNHAVVRDAALRIKDELLSRRMPPWHADPAPQHYSNSEMIPGDHLAMIVDWVDRGAPRGDGADPLADSVPGLPPDWPLGIPDRVVSLEHQTIPAAGTVDYRYLIVPSPFTNDVWISAAALKPGNRRVVHHVLTFSASSFEDILQIQGGLGGYFAAYVPGMEQVHYPAGTGKLLKKNAYLVFQLHYTATGQDEVDQSELGLYLASAPPERELRTAAAYSTRFTIPPRQDDHAVSASFVMPRDGTIYEMSPHMHYRGKWFRFEAVYPDNRRETLLNVPFYRFDWQTLYRLAEPRRVPAGTRIVVTGAWDNSSKNPFNPDPAASVTFGEQSWEEMFIGYFNWAE
ncbi:MAG: hypothetical protein IT580_03660 [Verrucomicrobiales bacterium]|nr:hypothetical protein [Verrucomicrobiales bacterium]